jgi:hypothetical protein
MGLVKRWGIKRDRGRALCFVAFERVFTSVRKLPWFFRNGYTFVIVFFKMLLGFFTRCFSPRPERRVADGGQGPVSILTPAAMASEGPSCPESPFLINLDFFTLAGDIQNVSVTVDYNALVNVVTSKQLKELGYEPQQRALPPDLSQLAAKELPGHCGWQQLLLYVNKHYSHEIQVLIVSDDYRCDLLLGREFKEVEFNPGAGAYPNFTNPKGKGTLTRAQRIMRNRFLQE